MGQGRSSPQEEALYDRCKDPAHLQRMVQESNTWASEHSLPLRFAVDLRRKPPIIPKLWKKYIKVLMLREGLEERRWAELTVMDFCKLFYSIFEYVTLVNLSKRREEGSDDPIESECMICLDDEKGVCLPCSHSFCQNCIDQWRIQNTTCPVCRASIGATDDAWVLAKAPALEEIRTLAETIASTSRFRSMSVDGHIG